MKQFVIMAGLCALSWSSFGCDVCGCSATGLSQGIMPGILADFVGASWSHRQFVSHHPGMFGNPGTISRESFSTLDLRARYSPVPRIQLLAFVPFNRSMAEPSEAHPSGQNYSGIGDPIFLGQFVVINRNDSTDKLSVLATAGGGFKAPLGRWEAPGTESIGVNPNMLPGTGSWDLMFSGSLAVRYKRFGMLTDFLYRANTANAAGYRFGNRSTVNASVFGKIGSPDAGWQLILRPGVSMENSHRDFDSRLNHENEFSGGNALFAFGAIDFFVGSFGFHIQYAEPLSQSLANGQLEALPRFNAGVVFIPKNNFFQFKKS